MALLLWLYAHIDECGIHTHELGRLGFLVVSSSSERAPCEELGPPQIWALGRSWVQTGRRGCPEVDIYAAEYDSLFVNIQYFLTLNRQHLDLIGRQRLVLALLEFAQFIVLRLAQVVVVSAQVVAHAHDRHHARAVARDTRV